MGGQDQQEHKPVNLSSRVRRSVIFMVIISLLCAVSLNFVTFQMGGAIRRITQQQIPAVHAIGEIARGLLSAHLMVTEMMHETTPRTAEIEEYLQLIQASLNKARQLNAGHEQIAALANMQVLADEYTRAVENMLEHPEDKDLHFVRASAAYSALIESQHTLAGRYAETGLRQTRAGLARTNSIRMAASALMLAVIVLGLLTIFGSGKTLAYTSRRIGNATASIEQNAFSTAAAAEEVAASATQVAQSMEQVATAIEQITIGCSQSADSTQEISQLMARVHGMAEEISGGANGTLHAIEVFLEMMKKVEQVSETGRLTVEDATQAIEAAMKSSVDAARSLSRFESRIGRMNEILEYINGLGKQTEMLALNATIEATRAGEQGRGFSIVAQEIRKLSAQNAEATAQIAGIIADSSESNSQMTSEIESILAAAQSIGHQTRRLKEIFLAMSESGPQMAAQMDRISSNAAHEVELIEATMAGFNNVREHTESIAAQIEEVSAAMQELNSTVQEVLAANEEMRSSASSQANNSVQLRGLTRSVSEEMASLV